VWRDKTRALRDAGKLEVVGIVQEQHPDRAHLYMQWQQLAWPVMVDALNLLRVASVPLAIGIDEHGVVRKLNMRPSELAAFVARSYAAPASVPPPAKKPDLASLRKRAFRTRSAAAWRTLGDATFLWADRSHTASAITAYQRALRIQRTPRVMFHLGVALRRRFEAMGLALDFAAAVAAWQAAVDARPNQYIWRRRIQQYGPRQSKPYPFYDWVRKARAAIKKRGETPVPLSVEPRGAELARPLARPLAGHVVAPAPAVQPDLRGTVRRDEGFVTTSLIVVPPHIRAGGSVRVYVRFQPRIVKTAHWNNEAEDLALWVRSPKGWRVDHQLSTFPRPKTDTSTELRRLEIELTAPATAAPGLVRVPAYATYYVCEDKSGSCLYRRRDLQIPVRIVP